jgi:hypothetical protein
MNCRVETSSTLAWGFCPDGIPALADRIRVIVSARLLDEVSGDPIAVSVTLSTPSSPGLHPRIAGGGLVGLVGRPAQLFPTLDVDAVPVTMRIFAPGYVPLELEGILGPIPGFPGQFAPLELGDVALHRAAVELSGRTLRRNGLAPVVVAGATVELVGFWAGFPPSNVNPSTVMAPPSLISLSPPVYGRREAGLTMVRRRDLLPVAGQEKRLLLSVAAGQRRLRLSDRIGLVINGLLTIDRDHPAHREHLLISDVDGGSSADQAAWITLAHPLAHLHRQGSVCQPANLAAPGSLNALARDAIAGDVTIFTTNLTGLADRITIEMTGGAGAVEFHEARLYRVVSDVDGFFRLPPLQRVAMVLIHSERLGLPTPADERFAPEYRQADNHLTVLFPP